MTTISSSSLGALLKNLYAPWEIEQLVNLTAPVLDSCARKGSANLGGAGFFFPVRAESAEGHAYISETQTLPTGRQSTVLTAQISPVIHAGVVQLSGLSMSVSSGDAMAFARAFDENVSQTIEAMTAYKEGAFFRDGTGLLTAINQAVVPNTMSATAKSLTLDDVGFLREGMYVDIIDSAATGTHHNSALKVQTVDWVNKKITVSTTPAAAADNNDLIYQSGSQVSGTAVSSKEPTGLEASLLSTGSYLGIARGTYSNWQANAFTASAFLDESILLRARTRLTQESGIQLSGMGGRFKVLTHPQQVDVLFKLAIPRIRFGGGERVDLGNSTEVAFGGIPFVTSYLCNPAIAYLGDWNYSQSLYTPGGELHVDTEYNGSSLKWVATKDVGLVFVKEYHNFVVKRPNAFVRISSLSTPSR